VQSSLSDALRLQGQGLASKHILQSKQAEPIPKNALQGIELYQSLRSSQEGDKRGQQDSKQSTRSTSKAAISLSASLAARLI
jgi:hypothetical protein